MSVRAQWMLAPEDPFEGESRWLTLLREEERYLEGVMGEGHINQRRAFRLGVESQLPDEVSRPKGGVNFRSMLDDLGKKDFYRLYKVLSQYTHGTLHATSHYQQNLGTAKTLGEWIEPSMWRSPLEISFMALADAGHLWLLRSKGRASSFLGHGWYDTVRTAIEEVGHVGSRGEA